MTKGRFFIRLLFALLLAAELTVLADLLCAAVYHAMHPAVFGGIFVACAGLCLLLKGLSLRLLRIVSVGILCACVAFSLVLASLLAVFAARGKYAQVDDGKAALYGGRKVLIIAPHEDDELNMASGVIEEYIKYGSQVHLLFATNGDYKNKGEKRLKEALKVAVSMGIARENVTFLGYGDSWKEGKKHIYNCPEDQQEESHCGRDSTYGLPDHPAFRENHSYTRRHYRQDLRDAILEYEPDVIFCTGYEQHWDHRALSLFFDEAMAEILSSRIDYHPLVLKTQSYYTAYIAKDDFYCANIISTKNPSDSPYIQNGIALSWAERVRLPVSTKTLSRSIFGSDTYWQLRMHATQGAFSMAEGIINGDKVFWRRDTTSLCYDAEISVSSGKGDRLNDFKLVDSSDVMGAEMPLENTWVPDDTDTAMTATVEFPEETDLTEIRLYDSPSLSDNVLNARLSFDDGTSLETGELEPNGSATEIEVDKEGVRSFTVSLLETQGESAGLTEIEAYDGQQDGGLDYVKLENTAGDFVYDYYIDESGQEDFDIFTDGHAADCVYTVSCDNPDCSASIHGESVSVSCPANQECEITVSNESGKYSDTVLISNPGRFMRSTGQALEQFCRSCVEEKLDESNTYLLIQGLYRLIRYGSTASA